MKSITHELFILISWGSGKIPVCMIYTLMMYKSTIFFHPWNSSSVKNEKFRTCKVYFKDTF